MTHGKHSNASSCSFVLVLVRNIPSRARSCHFLASWIAASVQLNTCHICLDEKEKERAEPGELEGEERIRKTNADWGHMQTAENVAGTHEGTLVDAWGQTRRIAGTQIWLQRG